MAIKRWHDGKEVGKRLAEHRIPNLLSLDLEGSRRIGAIGAVHTGHSKAFAWQGNGSGLGAALADLDEFAKGAQYLVGHNIIEHDLELLSRHAPDLELLAVLRPQMGPATAPPVERCDVPDYPSRSQLEQCDCRLSTLPLIF